MWRRYGDAAYAVIALAVFTIEAIALGVLTWTFLTRHTSVGWSPTLETALIGAAGTTALLLMVVTAYTLTYQAISSRRETQRVRAADEWTARWATVVLAGAVGPEGPLSQPAEDALVDLRQNLRGAESQRVVELLDEYGVSTRLLERARRADAERRPGGALRAWLPHPRALASGLESLDALGKARLPGAFGVLAGLSTSDDPAIRVMALRALAGSVSSMPADRMVKASKDFVKVLATADLPAGAVEESLLLLEDAAPIVIGRMLDEPNGCSWLLPTALDSVGRLNLTDLEDLVADHLSHAEPEVRAAALRALNHIGHIPAYADGTARQLLHDDDTRVRTQAAHVARLLSDEESAERLWDLLGDANWWVRKAAAGALVQRGPQGLAMLQTAARSHPDRFGWQMAVQMLLENEEIGAAEAQWLRSAV